MEKTDMLHTISGYRERVQRISLFDIFSVFDRKQQTDSHDEPIDFFGLGLLTLLFFFEKMLDKEPRQGIRQLGIYLRKMTKGRLYDGEEDYIQLAKTMIDLMRPQGGRRAYRKFFNYETNTWETVDYSLLKVVDWDPVERIQYYSLDEQGLELIFSTKEYYVEFQMSISQMMLRKQLEKGEYLGALRQVEEMRINVLTIKEKMNRIRHDVQKSIVSEETYSRYRSLIEDINQRLSREQDEFVLLSEFVQKTQARLMENKELSVIEQQRLGDIVRIDNELSSVHQLHGRLLEESIDLKTMALEAAGESLYVSGLTTFNFDVSIARKVTQIPIPFEKTRQLAEPFLGIGNAKIWSPLAVFAPQRIDLGEKISGDAFFDEWNLKDENPLLKARQRVYRQVFDRLKTTMVRLNKKTVCVSQVLKTVGTGSDEEVIDTFIRLHQMSPIEVEGFEAHKEHIFYEAIMKLFPDAKSINAFETDRIVEKKDRYAFRDIEITIEEEEKDGSTKHHESI